MIAVLAIEIAIDPKTAAALFHSQIEVRRLLYLELPHHLLVIAISLFVLFWPARAIWSLMAFLKVYKEGDVYSLPAADALRRFGRYFMAVVIFWLLGSFALQVVLMTVNMEDPLPVEDFYYHSEGLGILTLFVLATVGALVAMIGAVMADAALMADEHRHIL